jgi:hypothetical protein
VERLIGMIQRIMKGAESMMIMADRWYFPFHPFCHRCGSFTLLTRPSTVISDYDVFIPVLVACPVSGVLPCLPYPFLKGKKKMIVEKIVVGLPTLACLAALVVLWGYFLLKGRKEPGSFALVFIGTVCIFVVWAFQGTLVDASNAQLRKMGIASVAGMPVPTALPNQITASTPVQMTVIVHPTVAQKVPAPTPPVATTGVLHSPGSDFIPGGVTPVVLVIVIVIVIIFTVFASMAARKQQDVIPVDSVSGPACARCGRQGDFRAYHFRDARNKKVQGRLCNECATQRQTVLV